jgi:hypothetical protein
LTPALRRAPRPGLFQHERLFFRSLSTPIRKAVVTPAEVLESHPADNDPALLGGLVDDGNERVDFRYQPEDSWTAICHPDDADKTLVRGDGALLYGYRRTTWLSYGFDRVIEFGWRSGRKRNSRRAPS